MAINCDVFCNDISDALKRHNYESNKLDEEIRYLDSKSILLPKKIIDKYNELRDEYFKLKEDEFRCIEDCRRRNRSRGTDTLEQDPVDPKLIEKLKKLDDVKLSGGRMSDRLIHNINRIKTKRLRRRSQRRGHKQRQSRKQLRSRRYKKHSIS